jgi:hypothetical protein
MSELSELDGRSSHWEQWRNHNLYNRHSLITILDNHPCTRSRAESDNRSAAKECGSIRADRATLEPEVNPEDASVVYDRSAQKCFGMLGPTYATEQPATRRMLRLKWLLRRDRPGRLAQMSSPLKAGLVERSLSNSGQSDK